MANITVNVMVRLLGTQLGHAKKQFKERYEGMVVEGKLTFMKRYDTGEIKKVITVTEGEICRVDPSKAMNKIRGDIFGDMTVGEEALAVIDAKKRDVPWIVDDSFIWNFYPEDVDIIYQEEEIDVPTEDVSDSEVAAKMLRRIISGDTKGMMVNFKGKGGNAPDDMHLLDEMQDDGIQVLIATLILALHGSLNKDLPLMEDLKRLLEDTVKYFSRTKGTNFMKGLQLVIEEMAKEHLGEGYEEDGYPKDGKWTDDYENDEPEEEW